MNIINNVTTNTLKTLGYNGHDIGQAYRLSQRHAFEAELWTHESALDTHWNDVQEEVRHWMVGEINKGRRPTSQEEIDTLDCAIIKYAGVTPEKTWHFSSAYTEFREILGLPDCGTVRALFSEQRDIHHAPKLATLRRLA